jgi:hypothetical protein
LPESYQWLLVPVQSSPQAAVTWEAIKVSGTDPLAVRSSKRLRTDELLLLSFHATRLKMELDRVPLWRGNHVPIRQLIDDFARYPYLPRLRDPRVLLNAINDGVNSLVWERDGFAYAESFNETDGRYLGLRGGAMTPVADEHAPGLVVKSDIAQQQLDAERTVPKPNDSPGVPGITGSAPIVPGGVAPVVPLTGRPTRYHGSVALDATRLGRDAGKIAEEVIAHLSGLVGADVKVTLEIEATIPSGAPDSVVRTVTENGRTLRFSSQGFEKE